MERELELKHILKVVFYLRKHSVNEDFVTQEDIMNEIIMDRSQLSIFLKILKEKKVIDIKMINNTKNTGSRRMYRLNKQGHTMVDNIIAKALKNDEIKIFNLCNNAFNMNSNLQKDFRAIINLFYEYGFNENALFFSEMLKNFDKKVKKFFRYESQYNQLEIDEQESNIY
ncbi:MAG: hypothetical protein ACFFG0_16860 [Candidatus Thorarchaeota archaeon]